MDASRPLTSHDELDLQVKLFKLKWPNGFECPRCSCGKYSLISTRRQPLFECASCRHMTSLKVGTVMEGSRTPLWKWAEAIRLLARNAPGTSAVELARTIEVTYKTAWLILHKLRHAMGQHESRRLLTGFVRINAAKYGNAYNSSIYRHPKEHPLMSGATIEEQDRITQLKIHPVPPEHCVYGTADHRWHRLFVDRNVDPDNADVQGVVPKYGNNRYQPLLQACKRMSDWLNDTFHGIGAKHLRAYTDEYCCRFNLEAAAASSLFDSLLVIAVSHARIMYRTLINRPRNGFSHSEHSQAAAKLISRFALQPRQFGRIDTA